MNKKSNKNIMIIASIIITIILCVAFTSKSFQNDTFYTIKIGKYILKHGIDMKDHFSFHKLNYTYPHWLYDIIIYKIYSISKFSGLYIFNIICFIIISLTFYYINQKLNKNTFLSLLFNIFLITMLARFITTRAQTFTYFLFLQEIYLIELIASKPKKRYIISLLIICIIIANIHTAVWPFYFVLMLPYITENLIAHIIKKISTSKNKTVLENKLIIKENPNIKYLLITFLISIPLGLLTPIGLTPYTYFIKTLLGNSMTYIDEHQPLVLIKNPFVIIYIFLFIIPLIFTKTKIKLSDLFMILGLLIMTFISQRHASLLAIIGIFYLTRLYSNLLTTNNNKLPELIIPSLGSITVLIAVIISSLIVYNINSKESYIDETEYPVEMVKYMKKNLDLDKVKLFNEYNFGSYLIFKDIPVYIDSRSDLYTKPFNQKFDIYDEYINIYKNYGRVFNKYKITHILLYENNGVSQILSASPNYKVVHKDSSFVLYEFIKEK